MDEKLSRTERRVAQEYINTLESRLLRMTGGGTELDLLVDQKLRELETVLDEHTEDEGEAHVEGAWPNNVEEV